MPAILKSIVLLICASSLYSKVLVEVDFGERGNTQKIAETSLIDQFQKSVQDFNATEKFTEFKGSVSKIADASLNANRCEQNITRDFIPILTLSKNYYTPDGRIVGKAGDKINPLKNTPLEIDFTKIIVFDGMDKKHIDYVKKICAAEKRCNLFLNNGNSLEIEKNHGMLASPMPRVLANSIDLRCSMSIYEKNGEQFRIQEVEFTEQKQ